MTLLIRATDDMSWDSEPLREVRVRARALYGRAWGVIGVDEYGRRVRVPGVPPSRAELDELWAMIPPDQLWWVRRHVAAAVERARARGSTATPQTVERGT